MADNDWVRVTTRRTSLVIQAMVVRTIRPDTVFIPYHWPGQRSANRLPHRTIDPRCLIPEFKVSACRLEKTAAPAELAAWRREETGGGQASAAGESPQPTASAQRDGERQRGPTERSDR